MLLKSDKEFNHEVPSIDNPSGFKILCPSTWSISVVPNAGIYRASVSFLHLFIRVQAQVQKVILLLAGSLLQPLEAYVEKV